MSMHKACSVLVTLLLFMSVITIFSMNSVRAEEAADQGHVDKWNNGDFAEYSLSIIYAEGTYSGSLSFNVINSTIVLNVNFDHPTTPIKKSINIALVDNNTYFNGKEATLPFFYSGDRIAYYDGHSEMASDYTNWSGNTAGGPTNGQPVTSVTAESTYERFNQTYQTKAYYDFGTNSGLLFSADIPVYSVLFDELLAIQGANGVYPSFHISLEDTNIDLGSVNILAMIVGYSFAFAPIILAIIAIVVLVVLYNRSNKKKRKR